MGNFQKGHNDHGKRILFICLLVVCMFLWTREGKCENNEYSPGILRVGLSSKFFSDVNQSDVKVAFELLTRELNGNPKRLLQGKPEMYDNLQSIVRAVKNREVDVIALTVIDYLKIRDKVPLEPAVVGSKRGSVNGEELVFIVRRGQGITDIGQLKGKRLVVHANFMLDTADIWLSNVLTDKHLPERDRLFGTVREVKKASQAVLPVFFNQADACIVTKGVFDTMIELNPQLGKELMVLLSSDNLLYGVFCFSKHLSADVKAKLMKTCMTMNTTAPGKQILTIFHIDTLDAFKPFMLDTTVALLKKQRQLGGELLAKKQRE